MLIRRQRPMDGEKQPVAQRNGRVVRAEIDCRLVGGVGERRGAHQEQQGDTHQNSQKHLEGQAAGDARRAVPAPPLSDDFQEHQQRRKGRQPVPFDACSGAQKPVQADREVTNGQTQDDRREKKQIFERLQNVPLRLV
jgi:hypothetical protein